MKELIIEYCSNESEFETFSNEILNLNKFVKERILSPNQQVEDGVYLSHGESFGIFSFPNSNCSCFVFKPFEILQYYYRLSNYNRTTTRKAIQFLTEIVERYNQSTMREKIHIVTQNEVILTNKKNIERITSSQPQDTYVSPKELTKFRNDGIRLLNFSSSLSDLLYSALNGTNYAKVYNDKIKKTPNSTYPIIMFSTNHVLSDFKKEEITNIFSYLSYILIMIFHNGKKCDFDVDTFIYKMTTNILQEMNYQLIQQVDRECILYRQNLINELLSKYNVPK